MLLDQFSVGLLFFFSRFSVDSAVFWVTLREFDNIQHYLTICL